MESTLRKPALVAGETTPKAATIVCWIVTALLCLQAKSRLGAERA